MVNNLYWIKGNGKMEIVQQSFYMSHRRSGKLFVRVEAGKLLFFKNGKILELSKEQVYSLTEVLTKEYAVLNRLKELARKFIQAKVGE